MCTRSCVRFCRAALASVRSRGIAVIECRGRCLPFRQHHSVRHRVRAGHQDGRLGNADGWTDVAGIGVLVESNVPVALRCATPPQVIYGPVVVAREFRSRNSDETIQEMLGLTPAKDELGVRNLLARKQSASGCHSPVGFGWLGTNSSYLRPPFVIDWGWTGYQPLRSIKAPAVLPVDLVSSSGKTFGSGRIFNYFFLKHGVLLRVYAFGSASTKVMQDVVAQMAERA